MNENLKTLLFAAVAAVAVAAALVTRPSPPAANPDNVRGQLLFRNFTNPLDVTSVEILEWDADNAAFKSLVVAQLKQRSGKVRWVIPSHDAYPADASKQVADAATDLMGVKILGVASENEGDQRLYGVVDPDPKTMNVGDTGFGTHVVMKDKDNKTLLAVVLGKKIEDKKDFQDKRNLRYVRKIGQNAIYIVDANAEKLNPKFENWIERNLLDIKTIDVKRVLIRDYTIKEVPEGDQIALAITQRRQIDLDYDDAAETRWKLSADQKFVLDKRNPESGRWAPVKMADDEELNLTRLDDLKNALDDLKIVDVSRKPPGLSADLRVSADFSAKASAVMALRARGFYAARFVENGPMELLSNDGEVRVQQSNGVEYVLRFGAIADTGAPKKKAKPKAKKKPKEFAPPEESPTADVLRYLFVTAEFNPDLVAKPELLELKKEAEPAKKPAETKADKKADAAKAEKKPEDKKPGKPSDKKPETKPVDPKAEEARRAAIEKENKRRREEYQQRIDDGKKRVAELNARFADWYYIIADDVYQKIHLNRDAIVKKKEKKKEGADEAKGPHADHEHAGETGLPPAPLETPAAPAEKNPEPPKQEKGTPAEKKPEPPKQEKPAPAEKKPQTPGK